MSGEPTTAIVLRCVEFSETSLIVSMLTRDFGRISAMAKGARRPKGPFEGALDLLSVCRIVVIRKQGDKLDLLTEAKLHRRFRCGERSIPRLYAGYAVAELLRLLTDDDEPQSDVYDLTIATLAQIDGEGDPAASLLFFEIQLLRLLGHNPSTDVCTGCGIDLAIDLGRGEATHVFSLDGGGLVCGDCRSRSRGNIVIDTRSLSGLITLADPATRLPVKVSADAYGPIRALVSRYVQSIAGREPRMQAFVPTEIRV